MDDTKHDQDDNPFSVDEIEPHLYLGNCTAARNIDFIKSHSITHILTIDSFPIPNYVCSSTSVVNKYVQLADMGKEAIIEHFAICLDFIDEALKIPENNVLVHCFYGVSRSATIIIAFLMKKYSMSYQKAFERAKSKRVLVHPNNGFVSQLKLFHLMGCKIDPTCKSYKIFRLKLAADSVCSARILPSAFMNLISPDPALMQERPEPHVYRCRKCRRIVASKSNLITHKAKDQETPFQSQTQRPKESQNFYEDSCQEDVETIDEPTNKEMVSAVSDKSLTGKEAICTKVLFVEPMTWMDVVNKVEGKLYCPSCKSKIGSFNWIMASKCPCGKSVFPSFYLIPSKIDYSNVVQNIFQVTI